MSIIIVLNPEGSTLVWNVTTVVWNVSEDVYSGNISEPTANVSANDMAGIFYSFTGPPEISVSRSNTGATITLVNDNKYDIRLYRAEDHRALFYKYVDQIPTSSNYSDNGVWNTYTQVWDSTNVDYDEYSDLKNYKYKASFIAIGTKNGVAYELESQTSPPVYTIGERIL